jgi:acetolactate synthase-1/2/3 large subunit
LENEHVLILLGGGALSEPSQRLAWRIAALTRANIMAEGFNARDQRGRGRLPLERIPYAVEQATQKLATYRHIILVNAKPPVGFFAYPDKPSYLFAEGTAVHVLSRVEQDPQGALQALADELKCTSCYGTG